MILNCLQVNLAMSSILQYWTELKIKRHFLFDADDSALFLKLQPAERTFFKEQIIEMIVVSKNKINK